MHPGSHDSMKRVPSTPTLSQYTSTALGAPGCCAARKEWAHHTVTCLQTRHKGTGAWVCNICALR